FEGDAFDAGRELHRSLLHPLLGDFGEIAVRADLLDEYVDRGIELLLSLARARPVIEPRECQLGLVSAGLGLIQAIRVKHVRAYRLNLSRNQRLNRGRVVVETTDCRA